MAPLAMLLLGPQILKTHECQVDLLLYYTAIGNGHLGERWSRYSFIQAGGSAWVLTCNASLEKMPGTSTMLQTAMLPGCAHCGLESNCWKIVLRIDVAMSTRQVHYA